MQTFLPYPDFEESAYVLKREHLGKQRVENLQIMTALLERRGWINHPATLMWRGHEWTLLLYQEAICEEWTTNFGFKDTCLDKTLRLYFKHRVDGEQYNEPPWLGDEAFHISHQSNLVRKDFDYYAPQFPGVPDDIPYVWPNSKSNSRSNNGAEEAHPNRQGRERDHHLSELHWPRRSVQRRG